MACDIEDLLIRAHLYALDQFRPSQNFAELRERRGYTRQPGRILRIIGPRAVSVGD